MQRKGKKMTIVHKLHPRWKCIKINKMCMNINNMIIAVNASENDLFVEYNKV